MKWLNKLFERTSLILDRPCTQVPLYTENGVQIGILEWGLKPRLTNPFSTKYDGDVIRDVNETFVCTVKKTEYIPPLRIEVASTQQDTFEYSVVVCRLWNCRFDEHIPNTKKYYTLKLLVPVTDEINVYTQFERQYGMDKDAPPKIAKDGLRAVIKVKPAKQNCLVEVRPASAYVNG